VLGHRPAVVCIRRQHPGTEERRAGTGTHQHLQQRGKRHQSLPRSVARQPDALARRQFVRPVSIDRDPLEFAIAGALSPDAKVELSGVLLKNNVDVGVGTGTGTISARFVVRRGADVRYDSVKTATGQWDSSFAAAIAVPKATQEYPLVVQKLLASLYADPAFTKAIQ
jgi:hypothetical protein